MITRGYSSQTIHDITDHIDAVIVAHYEDNHGKIKYYAPSLYELVKSVIEEDIKNESDAAELKKTNSRTEKETAVRELQAHAGNACMGV